MLAFCLPVEVGGTCSYELGEPRLARLGCRRKLQHDIAQRVLEGGYEFNRKAWKVSAMRSTVGVTVASVAIKAVRHWRQDH